jgi:hypothetical protein
MFAGRCLFSPIQHERRGDVPVDTDVDTKKQRSIGGGDHHVATPPYVSPILKKRRLESTADTDSINVVHTPQLIQPLY